MMVTRRLATTYSGASWEAYERKKRPREDDGEDGDEDAIGA